MKKRIGSLVLTLAMLLSLLPAMGGTARGGDDNCKFDRRLDGQSGRL